MRILSAALLLAAVVFAVVGADGSVSAPDTSPVTVTVNPVSAAPPPRAITARPARTSVRTPVDDRDRDVALGFMFLVAAQGSQRRP